MIEDNNTTYENGERLKVRLFTDSDLDGAGCHLALKVANSNIDLSTVYTNAKNVNDAILEFIESEEYKEFNKVYITDLVIYNSVAKKIDEVNSNYRFKLVDQHKSNYINRDFPWVRVYENFNGRKTCGTELFWNFICEMGLCTDDFTEDSFNSVVNFVELVRLWDTWEWQSAGEKGVFAKDLNTVLRNHSKYDFVDMIADRIVNYMDLISDTDRELIRFEETKKIRYIYQKMRTLSKGVLSTGEIFATCFAESYISELGNYIAKNVKGIDFVAIINVSTGVVSLRALKDSKIDLSEIAKAIGNGGGHPASAGFTYSEEFNNLLITNIFNIKPMSIEKISYEKKYNSEE